MEEKREGDLTEINIVDTNTPQKVANYNEVILSFSLMGGVYSINHLFFELWVE